MPRALSETWELYPLLSLGLPADSPLRWKTGVLGNV